MKPDARSGHPGRHTDFHWGQSCKMENSLQIHYVQGIDVINSDGDVINGDGDVINGDGGVINGDGYI